jgi:hypothetical protein
LKYSTKATPWWKNAGEKRQLERVRAGIRRVDMCREKNHNLW